MDTDEKAKKSLFPIYLQILLRSKCSKYKHFNIFDIEGDLQIYTGHSKMENPERYIVDSRNQSWEYFVSWYSLLSVRKASDDVYAIKHRANS